MRKGLGRQRVDEEEAFRHMYDDNRDGLYAYLLSQTDDRDDALDLLQETFTRAWRQLSNLVPESPEIRRYWLYAVARNASVDRYRRQVASPRASLSAAHELSASDPGPEEVVGAAEELVAVGRAVAELPAALRDPLVMSTVGGLSSAAIGEALGIPAAPGRHRSVPEGTLGRSATASPWQGLGLPGFSSRARLQA
jgi:RNA polymerase sigma factor (sigma-70 family)